MSAASTLRERRQALIDALAGLKLEGKTVARLEAVPSPLVPPAAVLTAGSPYLDGRSGRGRTYGTWDLEFILSLVVRPGDNVKMVRDLDQLIGLVIDQLATGAPEFQVTEASAFYVYSQQQANFLACDLTVTDSIQFTD